MTSLMHESRHFFLIMAENSIKSEYEKFHTYVLLIVLFMKLYKIKLVFESMHFFSLQVGILQFFLNAVPRIATKAAFVLDDDKFSS